MSTAIGTRVLVIALLALFAAQAISSLRQKSVTTDEITYIAAGYYYLETGDFRYNVANPPLAKILSALPLLSLNLELPEVSGRVEDWSEVEQWQFAREFFYENRVDADKILFFARIPIVTIGLVLGLFVFLWSSAMYGRVSGIAALFLFAFSPNILAHARLATQDLALAALLFIAAFYLWRFTERPNWLALISTAIFYSLALVTKTSAFMLVLPIGIFVIAVIVSGRPMLANHWPIDAFSGIRNTRLQETLHFSLFLAVIALVAGITINLAYAFDGSFASAGTYERVDLALSNRAAKYPTIAFLFDWGAAIPIPFPEPFVRMLEFQFARVSSGNNIYFMGETSRSGWWYVIPVAFLIKTPIPVLLLTAAAILVCIRSRKVSSGETILWAFTLYFLCLFAYLKSISIGLRYLLVVYPCLHVLIGGLFRHWPTLSTAYKGGAIALVIWYLTSSALTFPHYIPYFNEFVGGPRNGHKFLADSFVDWGQDLPALKSYMEEKNIEKIRLAYFGSADANYYGINYDYLPSVGLAPREEGQAWWYEAGARSLPELDLEGGPIAISVTLLAGVFYPGYYAPLREYEPIDSVGHSILIYDPSIEKSD